MRKPIVLVVVFAVSILAAHAPPVWSNICAMDDAPAASLLFPFVVFDYSVEPSLFSDPPIARANTILSITNMSAEAQIVRVAVWTDFGIAIFNFNILLTGYDVVTFSMDDILLYGQLPVTVAEAHSTNEGMVSKGPVSEESVLNGSWVASLSVDPEATTALGSRCDPSNPTYPGNYSSPIGPATLALYQSYLQSSQTAARYHTDDCILPYSGASGTTGWLPTRDSDDHTWLYITADVVENCNANFPDETGYWIPGQSGGEARYDNVLTGHVTWEFPPFIRATGNAVHIEADTDLQRVATENGGYLGFPRSFYARYSNPNDSYSDYREPLPTAWAMPYEDSTWLGRSSIVMWKGSTIYHNPLDLAFTPYNESPAEFMATNCDPYTYYVWDNEENVINPVTGIQPNLLPLAVQEVAADQFDLVDTEGWILFVFPESNYIADQAPATKDYYQTWMGSFLSFGPTKTFRPGHPVANSNCYSDQVLPGLGVSYPYVDSGGYTVSPCTVYDACYFKSNENSASGQGVD